MTKSKLFSSLICFFLFSLGLSAQYLDLNPSKDTLKNIDKFDFKPSITAITNQSSFIKKFDPTSLPVFCRIEYKIESKSKIAFRFRLGDLNYVNMLENKR